MANAKLILPDDYEDYAREVISKGWFGRAIVRYKGLEYELTFYDPYRLKQAIHDALEKDSAYFECNLVVVTSVTRELMEKAVKFLEDTDTFDLMVSRKFS